MRHARDIQITHPWCNVVTTQGDSPWLSKPNDGVVTVSSQKKRNDIMELIELDCNHYEVVLNTEVVKLIQQRLPQ
jgi:hypothetical protein